MNGLAEVGKILNQLRAQGVVQDYAIGGATAFLFYAEPLATFDVDVFVIMPRAPARLVTLSTLYAWLRERGFEPRREHVLIHGVPVQFLVADLLAHEAVERALLHQVSGEPVRVLTPEHLIAMSVQAGGLKRRERVAHLRESHPIDQVGLGEILRRHGLLEVWQTEWKAFHG